MLMKKHLAIMNKPTIEAILAGKKTIETRFSLHKISPFESVAPGDLVYMKPPGEEIVGQFRVKKVFSFAGLVPEDMENIFKSYGKQIAMGDKVEDDKYKEEKKGCKYGTLIFISESERFIVSPLKVKKSDMRGWMVIE